MSQHGADSHAWDPLAHLERDDDGDGRGGAARRRGRASPCGRSVAGHGRRRLRRVPGGAADLGAAWLAGAHREVPASTPVEWRERWAAEASRYGQAPLPETFDDVTISRLDGDWYPTNDDLIALETGRLVARATVPELVRQAVERQWWDPMAPASGLMPDAADDPIGAPTIIASVDAATWSRLSLLPRVVAPSDPGAAHDLIAAGLASEQAARVTAAVVGSSVVGLAVSAPADPRGGAMELLAVGVAPAFRRGLAADSLRSTCPGNARDGDPR